MKDFELFKEDHKKAYGIQATDRGAYELYIQKILKELEETKVELAQAKLIINKNLQQ